MTRTGGIDDSWGDSFESETLTRISVETYLEKLEPVDKELLLMVYAIERPADYDGPWPPTLTSVGVFLGNKYWGRPLVEATIRYRVRETILFLQGKRDTPLYLKREPVVPVRPVVNTSPESNAAPVQEQSTEDVAKLTRPLSNEEFNQRLERFGAYVRMMAKRLSRGDQDVEADLTQIAHIQLWESDFKGAKTNYDAYVRSYLKYKMIVFLRGNDRTISLNAVLDAGAQVVRTADGAEIVMADHLNFQRTHEDEDTEDK